MTPGQRAYEQELRIKPLYHDGTIRKRWDDLDEHAKWSWEKNPTPRWQTR